MSKVEDIMDNQQQKPTEAHSEEGGFVDTWGMRLSILNCDVCDWSYLVPVESKTYQCPHCFQGSLKLIAEGLDNLPYSAPPELILPFSANAGRLAETIMVFGKSIPYPPDDLKVQNLHSRLNCLYLPMWLVDVEVNATWKVEAGFNYQVISHQDKYSEVRGGWTSQEVKEERTRWEPRLGRLNRNYQNVAVFALDNYQSITRGIGDFDLSQAQVYRVDMIGNSIIRLPNRSPETAWTDATQEVRDLAADECRQAASADFIRQYLWKPDFGDKNWSLLLLPVYSTYYLDDDQKPQPVWLHGKTGRLSGVRKASMKRGQKSSLRLLAFAVVVFLLSVLFFAASLIQPATLILGIIGFVVALLLGMAAILPLARVWWFNRNQE